MFKEFIVDFYLSFIRKEHPVSIEYCGSNSFWNWEHVHKGKVMDHFVDFGKHKQIDISSIFGCKNVTIKINRYINPPTSINEVEFSLSILIIHNAGDISMFIPSSGAHDDSCFKLNLN